MKDSDQTRAFYADAFDFVTLFDEEISPELRVVHIGPPIEGSAGFLLIPAASPDADSRVGRQAGDEPAFVLYTTDLHGNPTRLARIGAQPFQGSHTDDAGSSFAHIRDNSGNELVLVQIPT